MDKREFEMSRRAVLKCGLIAGATVVGSRILGPAYAQVTDCVEVLLPEPGPCGVQEVWSTSPFIVDPFSTNNPLPVPKALTTGFRQPVGSRRVPLWTVRKSQPGCVGGVVSPALMRAGKQDSYGGMHQFRPADINVGVKAGVRAADGVKKYLLATTPLVYHIRVQLGLHSFTSSKVRPIDKNGNFLTQADLTDAGIAVTLDANGRVDLPASTIYGFNGTFPGPMINVEYGKPVIVRFENDLDLNPNNLNRGDFGVPQFLTHLHNGHTAPESDGQPHYMQHNDGGYIPGDFVDNLYLNWPAGGDPCEMQSFLWFHDHRMHHTGANVYKGMVGLFPMYDPGVPVNPRRPTGPKVPGTGLDPGDERKGLRLPGVRVRGAGGTFNVKYDIPMALYDCQLDDGVAPHADFRTGDPLIHSLPVVDPASCGEPQPDQWGKTFFRYAPNHGFVGDIFTVNGKAFPVLNVFKRRYRFRWLGASIARIYELAFMTSAAGPQPRPGTQGQWQIPDGRLWKPNAMTQIASMGGLLPKPVLRDSIQIWPATRREVIVDFTNANTGDVIYLTNLLEMKDGRKPDFNRPEDDLNTVPYKVPMLKIVVGGLPPERDNSIMPTVSTTLRPAPQLPTQAEMDLLPHRTFTLEQGGGFGDAARWVINGLPFDPSQSLTSLSGDEEANPGNIGNPKRGKPEIWTLRNGGGGWVHPMHMHQEEHTVIARFDGGNNLIHPDDTGKEDVCNLDENESVTVYRNFRTFTGPYVAHCHNLAHEDHNMMFGFAIDP